MVTTAIHRYVLLLLLVLASCTPLSDQPPTTLCTTDWFQTVEQHLQTSDIEGHGPDLGSSEWKSVVEFKLGIRGNPEIPESNTDEWCNFVNKHIQTDT